MRVKVTVGQGSADEKVDPLTGQSHSPNVEAGSWEKLNSCAVSFVTNI